MLTDLKNELKDLPADELRIIDARSQGYSLSEYNEEEFEAVMTGIIFNISVICGCQLPTHEAHINALEKEFKIFLRQNHYTQLTAEEVLTAFRMNANGQLEEYVKTFGAIFNIDFAGSVLSQYFNKRFSLDYKLEKIYKRVEADKIFESEANTRRVKTKKQFAMFLAGSKELDLSNCYMQLAEDGAFVDKSMFKKFTNHEAPSDKLRGGEPKHIGEFLSGYNNNLTEMFSAQAEATKYLFEQMKLQGKTEIYDDKLQLLHPGFSLETE